ncbi:MAG: FtsQ-type POTRA domain-containing protein [Candidatus Nealsonbacteria bacterium]|nr:MAG: FtsQ-type POTRA domain-containing protein [Candidatus Nealsonbacteria bacterium]
MVKTFRKPYRIKKQKSIISYRFFWLGILIFVILFSIFYFLFFSQTFQVEKIIVTGEEKVAKEDLKLLVEEKLEKKILFFKTKCIFLVNLNEIKKDILNNFPRVAEVEIGRGFPDALNIVVVEKFGLAVWCQTEQCFLVDNEGVIFEEIFDIDPKAFKIKNLALVSELKLGDKVIEKEKLNQVLDIESKLRDNLKIPLTAATIVSEERFNIKTLEGWEIYFNPERDMEWQLTKLRAVLEEEILPENRKNLEYIELRFGNFANPKYRDY